MFGSYNRVGQNFGILAAWMVFTGALTWRRHRKYIRELQAHVPKYEEPPSPASSKHFLQWRASEDVTAYKPQALPQLTRGAGLLDLASSSKAAPDV